MFKDCSRQFFKDCMEQGIELGSPICEARVQLFELSHRPVIVRN